MFMKVGKRFGWLAWLALAPVVGWGQVIIEHPQNQTVCTGENAEFTSELDGGLSDWLLNGIIRQISPFEAQVGVGEVSTPSGSTIERLIVFYNKALNGLKVQSFVQNSGNSAHEVNSTTAYLFYKPNQQFPATDLIGAVNNGTAQIYWNELKSEFNLTTQYLIGVYDNNDNLVANQTTDATHASFELPPRANNTCQFLEFRVTAEQCPDPESPFVQKDKTTFFYREPDIDISPVTAEFDDNQTVLVSWTPDGGNAFQIVVTDLGSGNQTAYNSTQPFSYMAAGCDQPISLNVSVSPAECANDPAFTHSATVSFTIPCPTIATSVAEVTENRDHRPAIRHTGDPPVIAAGGCRYHSLAEMAALVLAGWLLLLKYTLKYIGVLKVILLNAWYIRH